MALTTEYKHIVIDEKGIPMIADTTLKVIDLLVQKEAYGWSPEELHFQHPHLSLGQIYSALAYYWDHKNKLDKDIERRLQFIDQIQKGTRPSPLKERLKSEGRL